MPTDFDVLIRSYLKLPQNRGESLDQVLAFLKEVPPGPDRTSRDNFRGHFTASCLLVDAIKRRILLFEHPAHNRILQPGGHFQNADESPPDVATRKVLDETNYSTDVLRYLPYDYNALVPIDIDTHLIEKTNKEPAHLHHDLRYVYLAVAGEGENREFQAKLADGTSHRYRWYDLAELGQFPTFERLRKKLHDFLSIDSARRRFFIGLTHRFPIVRNSNTPATIIVTHVLPDALEFLETLRQQTNLIGVIPKPKSKDEKTLESLKASGFPIIDVGRDKIAEAVFSLVGKSAGIPIVLLDIGGWFVPVLERDCSKAGVIGIVEDTKNGEKKYAELARRQPFPVPVVSLAESQLKANEDHLVGKSIVFSADAVLRRCGLVLDHLECSVIGYGKIGRSIALHLLERKIKPTVVETDALRSIMAFREGCAVRHRDWANRNVDVIFCATGSQATGIEDFRSLRSGAFIFSVTSSDDEFDTSMLRREYQLQPHDIWPDVTLCDGKQNHFYLVNNGDAVNFLHNAVLWEFIQLVKGGIYLAVRNLFQRNVMPLLTQDAGSQSPGSSQMFGLSTQDQELLGRLWLETVLLGVQLEK